MSLDREQLWAELEARAQRLLDHAKEVEPREAVRVYGSLLRLWHTPAFAPPITWTVLSPGRKAPADAPPLVRELRWNRAADHRRIIDAAEGIERMADCSPSILVRQAVLPELELRRHMELGARLTVPLVDCANRVGLDGEYFGLETYTVSPSLRAQWWCDGPVEWRHFTDWVAEVRAFLQRHLDQSG